MSQNNTPQPRYTRSVDGVPCMTVTEHEHILAAAIAAQADTQARWYCIDKSGMATLCTDKDDALQSAKDAQEMWPHNGPHRAVQLFEHPPAQAGQSELAQTLEKLTIVGMATAAHAIDFWDEHFDYVNSDPAAHSDMLQIARILRNPGDEIARLRGEIYVICDLMDQALDVMQTVDGDDDDEDRKILRLRAKMASAIYHFRGGQLLPAPVRQPLSESEITSLAYDCNALPEVVTDKTLIDFVRAIEAKINENKP